MKKHLFEVDETLSKVFLCVYDHSYSSFDGFSCYFTIATQNGELYVLDAIKFRDSVPNMRLLKCGVQKIIHCRECVKRLVKDFGFIGCYRNFDIFSNKVYID